MNNPDMQLCINANISSNYLAMAKFTNINKYNYIKKVGLLQYKEEQNNLITAIASMQTELTSARLGTKFFNEFLTDHFSTTNSFLNQCTSIAFRFRKNDIKYESFLHWNKIIDIYNNNKKQFFIKHNKKLSDYQ